MENLKIIVCFLWAFCLIVKSETLFILDSKKLEFCENLLGTLIITTFIEWFIWIFWFTKILKLW